MLETQELRKEDSKDALPALTPRHTLYINNMNEKVSLNKIKPVLSRLFGRYGTIVQITAHKNLKMKGQAFVTYKSIESCEKAIQKLQGRPIFRKPIHVTYAKAPSDEEHKIMGNTEAIEKRKEAKKFQEAEKEKESTGSTKSAGGLTKNQVKQWKALPPHNILLLQNLQEIFLDTEKLQARFSDLAGFERVRLIKFRKLAFIDFDLETNASKCLESVKSEEFGPEVLLTYAKK